LAIIVNKMRMIIANSIGQKIVAQMGMPEEWFHDLRHSYAVVSLESGDDVKTVQGNLGHATASFTLDVYGHVSQRMQQQSDERMELFFHTIS
jgi:integrase